jgi:type VI secretion system secreted protein Hcp
MSSDFHVKATNIDGESKKKDHEKQIDITSWSWSCTNSSSAQQGGGSGKGKAVAGDLTFTAVYSTASPVLAQRCASGKPIDELKLTGRKSGDGQKDYVFITLESAFVTSVSISGIESGDVSETVTCSYKKIKFEYKPQDAKGELGASKELKWDIETGVAEN